MLRLTLAFCWALIALPVNAQVMEQSMVRVTATKRPADVENPWQWQAVSQSTFLGVVLPSGDILTTAYTVFDAVDLEMRKFGQGDREELEVKFVDYEVNLALLRPKSRTALSGLIPLDIGPSIPLGAEVSIFKRRNDYRLTQIPGRFLEMGVYSSVTGTYQVATSLIKVQQSGMGWAEPVIAGGKLVALSSGQDSNYVHAIPSHIIQHFLKDAASPPYRGFPAIGIGLSALESPDARRYYKADSVDYGIRVSKVSPTGSFHEKLEVDDIVLQVGPHRISEHGYFSDASYGPLPMSYILNSYYAGDQLTLKVLREGQVREVTSTLRRHNSTDAPITFRRPGEPEPHLIFGGIVIQELSVPYMEQFGSDWRNLAPFDLLYTVEFENEIREEPFRYVVVSRVLADEFNRGYDKIRHALIKEVNGQPIDGLESVRKALKTSPISHEGKPYARISLYRDVGEILLSYEGVAEAHARITQTYSIANPDSFY